MQNATSRLGAAVLAVAAVLPFPSALAAGDADKLRLFTEAVESFRAGNADAARERLQQFLQQDLSNADVLAAASGPDEAVLFEMLRDDRLKELAVQILTLSFQQRELEASDPKELRKWAGQWLLFSGEGRAPAWEAEAKLLKAGEASGAVLVDMLLSTREQDERAKILALAEKLGPTLILPVAESLSMKDPELSATLVRLTAKYLSAAAAAVPAKRIYALACLQELRESPETNAEVKRLAGEALSAGGQKDGSARDLFYRSAEMFYRGSPQRLLSAEVGRLSLSLSQAWTWRDAGGLAPLSIVEFQTGKGTLPGFVPSFSYNEIMAQAACRRALRCDPGFDPALGLYACAVLSELVEARDLAAHTAAYPEIQAVLPAIEKRTAALEKEAARLRATGVRVLNGALRRALEDRQGGTAALLIRMVSEVGANPALPFDEAEYKRTRDAGKSRFLGAGLPASASSKASALAAPIDWTPLIDAMDDGNPRVQYEAALALASLDPVRPFFRRDRVAALLTRALSDITPKVVLVASPDVAFANQAAERLRAKGLAAVVATDGLEAVRMASEFPAKDAVILDHPETAQKPRAFATLRASGRPLSSQEVLLTLRRDFRTREIPVWVLLAQESPSATAVFEAGKPAGFLKRPLDDEAIAEIAKALAERTTETQKASEDLSLAAAMTLARIDPRRSVYAPDLPQAADALAQAVQAGTGRADQTLPDRIRMVYLTSLSRIGSKPEHFAVCLRTAENTQESPELRGAALRCAGTLATLVKGLPSDALRPLKELLASDDASVQAAAAWALGQAGLSSETVGELLFKPTAVKPAQ